MNNNTTRVSVLVPVHNGAAYLGEAIASALAQTAGTPEIIVVDDGSTDNSAAVAASFVAAVRLVSQEQRGIGAARNYGLNFTTAPVLAFLDSDDIWPADRLAVQLAALDADPQLEAVYGLMDHFISPDLSEEDKLTILRPPQPLPSRLATTMLIKRDVFERIGRHATNLNVGVDVEWFLRAQEYGLRNVMLNEVVLLRRLHKSNNGIQKQSARVDYTRVIRAALARRRAAERQSQP